MCTNSLIHRRMTTTWTTSWTAGTAKSRYTLRHLIAGKIKYRFFGKIGCPFCCKVIGGGIDGMIQHAFSTGNGHGKKHKASTLAKHAAYARFLEIVKVNEPYNMHWRRERSDVLLECCCCRRTAVSSYVIYVSLLFESKSDVLWCVWTYAERWLICRLC